LTTFSFPLNCLLPNTSPNYRYLLWFQRYLQEGQCFQYVHSKLWYLPVVHRARFSNTSFHLSRFRAVTLLVGQSCNSSGELQKYFTLNFSATDSFTTCYIALAPIFGDEAIKHKNIFFGCSTRHCLRSAVNWKRWCLKLK